MQPKLVRTELQRLAENRRATRTDRKVGRTRDSMAAVTSAMLRDVRRVTKNRNGAAETATP